MEQAYPSFKQEYARLTTVHLGRSKTYKKKFLFSYLKVDNLQYWFLQKFDLQSYAPETKMEMVF